MSIHATLSNPKPERRFKFASIVTLQRFSSKPAHFNKLASRHETTLTDLREAMAYDEVSFDAFEVRSY